MPISAKKIEILLIALLVIVSSFLRIWQIRGYVVFLGDEGRDMMVMRKMIKEKKPTFLGPTASVGGFYLGPVYYWMATPFLALWKFDPIGPSYMVALFGIGTVLLLFKFLKESVGFWPAIMASFLYATSPLIVRYSRSSWNPNPLPFFALTMLYSIYLGTKNKNPLFFLAAGACFGVAIQLHYLAIVLIPIAAVIVFLNTNLKKIPLLVALCAIGAAVTFSPFLLFEAKHNFPNFKTILEFVTRDTTHGYQTIDFLWLVANAGNTLLEYLSKLPGTIITIVVFWLLALGVIFGFFKNWKDKQKKLVFSIGLSWFIGGLLFLRYYTGQVNDYYYGFMFPAPFFAAGLVFSFFEKKKFLILIPVVFTSACAALFLKNGFYTSPPNKLINQTESVVEFVVEKTESKPYNFALITESNSDHAYRYFLDVRGHAPTELETLVTEQLFVVCETQECAPLGHPIWEIAGFGRAEIASKWKLSEIGITVFKLVHWPGEKSPAGKPAVKGK